LTTLLIIFLFSILLSLLLTPFAGRLGERFGAMDLPDERKVHKDTTPRTGGIAIFTSFFVTLGVCRLFDTDVSRLLVMDTS
jgi:UDP-GlcNAc:undecaprenyl-phosphate GlcNAc-1-phosphate transferase